MSENHRINIKNRTPLQDVIPLDTPFVVYVDPSSICNFRCKFCPTGEADEIRKTSRWKGRLTMDYFKKAIDDLEEFDRPIKALKLFKDGEPLLNQNFHEMVKYAKDSGAVNYIETTTNGALFTKDIVDNIIEAGINRINISVYGTSAKQFLDFTRNKVDFDAYVEQIRYLFENRGDCKIFIKTTTGTFEEDHVEEFYKIFKPISDYIGVEHISPFWPGYEFQEKYNLEINTKKGTFGNKLILEKEVCPYLFYAMAINSDGRVDMCSCDWRHDFPIGDIKEQSLKEVWNSGRLFELRMMHLRGKRNEHPLCRNCREISYEAVDNIDEYAEDIILRLEKRELQ